MAKRKLIPFNWLPGSWGLKGKTYEKARAEYELTGDDLVIRIAEIEHGANSKQAESARIEAKFNKKEIDEYTKEVELSKIEFGNDAEKLAYQLAIIDFEHNKITEYDMLKKHAEMLPEPARAKELLNIEYEYHKINEVEYQKQTATLANEPWVHIGKVELNKENPTIAGEFELDWNDQFVSKLKENGFNGPSDYSIVEKWFQLFCSAVASENGIIDNTTKKVPGFPGPGDVDDNGLGEGRREYF